MTFAEKILESIVDENGYCGERGLSAKQFGILEKYLDEVELIECGGWEGKTGGYIPFWQKIYKGEIGRFEVELVETKHFRFGHGVIEIKAKYSKEEREEELKTEKVKKEEKKEAVKNSQWVGDIKERLEFDCKVLTVSEYESRYGKGVRIEFLDNDGNVFVWFTSTSPDIEEGSEIRIRATVKDHSEWNGIKQNIVNRVNVR